jgi:hypothetical protein
MKNETLSFNITNSTNGIIPSSILGNPANPMDNANATTRYAWNVTTLSFGSINSISIQYRGISQTIFSVASLNVQVQNYQEICNSLNTLDLGVFFVTTSGGSTFINNYNENYVFGNLEIFDNLTANVQFNNFTTVNPLFSQITFTPFNNLFAQTTIVIAGDGFTYNNLTNAPPFTDFVFSTSIVGTQNSYLEVILNGVTIYSVFGTSFSFPSTTLIAPNQYLINWYDVAP